jgi:beta-lactamase regulating signal transducer with metallopeptidase domain
LIAVLLRRQSAAARHAVWAGAFVALLALPALTSGLPRIRVPLLAAPSSVPTEFSVSGATEPSVQDGGASSASRRPQTMYTSASGDRIISDGMYSALIALWLCGALALTCRRLLSELLSRRLAGSARPARVEWTQLCAAESGRLALRTVPRVLTSTDVAVPATAGVLRPVVLLPAEADTWTGADAAAALIHELGHITRRDGLMNLIADLATAVYWINPAVWLARARLRAESERACDDLVLARGTDPGGYAALLLRAARACRERALPTAATAMARPQQLESRLRAVLDDRIRRGAPPRRIATALGTAGLLVALPACAVTFRAESARVDLTAPEPDRAGDALALPGSERLPALSSGYAVPAAAVAALLGPDSALVSRLIAALEHEPQHDSDLVRDRAAWALAQARDGRLVEPLLDALAAADWRVQAYAAWALTTARDPRAVPTLIQLLDHPVWRLRAMAAAALREAGDPQAIDAMTTALDDPAWQVRLEAVEYFLSLGGADMTEHVRAHRNDRHIAVRLAARRDALSP